MHYQLSKYIAKFYLLERGLLDAAQGVDDIQLHTKVKPGKDKRTQNNQEDGEEEEDDEEHSETLDEFQARVTLYTRVHLSRASSSKRDHYKDGLVYQTRKDLITEFLKTTILKKCQNGNCSA